jgi:hypothetical protein
MDFSFLNREAAKPKPLVNLQNIRIASPCPADWNMMAGDDRVRHCSDCNLNVFNLSAMTEREVQRLIANNQGRVCGRFYRRADGTILTQDCPRGLRAVARRVSRTATAVLTAVLSVGFAFAGTKPKPQQTEQNQCKEPGVALLVMDPAGAVIQNAGVTLTSKTGKKEKIGTTDRNGYLFLKGLPSGDYLLEVKAPGFLIFRQSVPVREGKLENITLRMELDSDVVTVEVGQIGPPLIQTESTVSTAFQSPLLMPVMPSRGQYQPLR